ncbi:hypothetical protein V1505DRAFT_379767 [Lipomyces doorenjongii]
MCIREERRRQTLILITRPGFQGFEKENTAVAEAEEDFRHQLTECAYGALVKECVTWFRGGGDHACHSRD